MMYALPPQPPAIVLVADDLGTPLQACVKTVTVIEMNKGNEELDAIRAKAWPACNVSSNHEQEARLAVVQAWFRLRHPNDPLPPDFQ